MDKFCLTKLYQCNENEMQKIILIYFSEWHFNLHNYIPLSGPPIKITAFNILE